MSWLSLNSLHLSKCSPILSLINDPRIAPGFLFFLKKKKKLSWVWESCSKNSGNVSYSMYSISNVCICTCIFSNLCHNIPESQNPKSAYFILKVEILYISFPEKEQSTSIKETVNQIFYAWITEVSCHYKSLSFGWKEKDNFQDAL